MRFISRLVPFLLCVVLLIGAFPFSAAALEANGYSYIINEDGVSATITGYNGTDTVLTIPSEIGGLTVTAIDERAFEAKSTITAVTVPASVKTIGTMAFYNCLSLETINLSPYTFDLGYQSFHNTAWFMNAEEGSLYIGRVFYSYVGTITDGQTITINYGTAAIAPYALSGRKKLHAVYLPVGLRKIGDCAFSSCTNLMEVRMPPSVTELGNSILLRSESATVTCVIGSAVYQYVDDNNLYFMHDESLDYPAGDLNKDGVTNSTDYRKLMLLLLDDTLSYDLDRYWSCDAEYDGTIDSSDVRALMKQTIAA
ncbi:MAG: leucine-rich repeat protein [Clostridia bacterium]|nr:leucine-rich repeat protein [Clostridia bacterium]